jgi:hypothetical protein
MYAGTVPFALHTEQYFLVEVLFQLATVINIVLVLRLTEAPMGIWRFHVPMFNLKPRFLGFKVMLRT